MGDPLNKICTLEFQKALHGSFCFVLESCRTNHWFPKDFKQNILMSCSICFMHKAIGNSKITDLWYANGLQAKQNSWSNFPLEVTSLCYKNKKISLAQTSACVCETVTTVKSNKYWCGKSFLSCHIGVNRDKFQFLVWVLVNCNYKLTETKRYTDRTCKHTVFLFHHSFRGKTCF